MRSQCWRWWLEESDNQSILILYSPELTQPWLFDTRNWRKPEVRGQRWCRWLEELIRQSISHPSWRHQVMTEPPAFYAANAPSLETRAARGCCDRHAWTCRRLPPWGCHVLTTEPSALNAANAKPRETHIMPTALQPRPPTPIIPLPRVPAHPSHPSPIHSPPALARPALFGGRCP